ncbi:uncharacterized protein LOC119185430 isoform X4 [Rhipicephalus microplus]|uniref:uncharacterized protein LOC119185430 isoform X4 n=1 Tax=Rhipicephalus microplus TaxID=6941 RepID=UPI003F6C4FEF
MATTSELGTNSSAGSPPDPKMNVKALLIALVACALLLAGTEACGGEGRSESGRCGGSEGRSQHGEAEARQESEADRCSGSSGRCDG